MSSSTFGERAADILAKFVGSWKFVIIQTVLIMLWVAVNLGWLLHVHEWDPYPFILLNLMFSVQAAYTGPIIMISNNRQDALQAKQMLYMMHTMEAAKAILEDTVLQRRVYELDHPNASRQNKPTDESQSEHVPNSAEESSSEK